MRSKPQDPNIRKVAIVLLILAVAWLVVGTLFLLKIKDTIINGTYSANGQNVQTEEKSDTSDDIEKPEEEPDNTYVDDSDDADDTDGSDDADAGDSDGVSSADNSDSSLDSADDDDEDFDDDNDAVADDNDVDDSDDDENDEDDDVATFTVDAWDGFAAVRTGRGTGYQQVGKLNNGAKVQVTDLENGWYKIAKGKWKGYYLHKSSLK